MAIEGTSHPGMFSGASTNPRPSTIVAGGASLESLAGIGAVVLAILGLVNIEVQYLLPIACIALGVAFLAQGLSIADRYSELLSRAGDSLTDEVAFGAGLGAEFAGGVAGIVLGILAIIGVVPLILVSVAAIVFGGTLLMSSGEVAEFNRFASSHGFASRAQLLSRQALKAASGTQALVGLGAVALGILALLGIYSVTLDLVAMLAVGASTAISGAALGVRMSIVHQTGNATI